MYYTNTNQKKAVMFTEKKNILTSLFALHESRVGSFLPPLQDINAQKNFTLTHLHIMQTIATQDMFAPQTNKEKKYVNMEEN